jgi:hypothetical protein
MDKEPDQQDPARDQVQEETQRVKKERPIHIQIKWKYLTKKSSKKL